MYSCHHVNYYQVKSSHNDWHSYHENIVIVCMSLPIFVNWTLCCTCFVRTSKLIIESLYCSGNNVKCVNLNMHCCASMHILSVNNYTYVPNDHSEIYISIVMYLLKKLIWIVLLILLYFESWSLFYKKLYTFFRYIHEKSYSCYAITHCFVYIMRNWMRNIIYSETYKSVILCCWILTYADWSFNYYL